MTSSTISRASSSIRVRSSSALRGVNPRLTSNLKRSCSGGSITSIICRWIVRFISSLSAIITPRAAELNSFGWRLIARMSA